MFTNRLIKAISYSFVIFGILMLAFVFTSKPAAASSIGDMLKTWFSGTYVSNGQSKMAFPDNLTIESWGSPAVSEVDASVLADKTFKGVIPLRSGSSLVKFGNDPQVYAIGPNGTLHWIASEEIASALYGDQWGGMVVSLFYSYYVNYAFGPPITEEVHPNGTLFKYADDPTVYYLINEVARPFVHEKSFKDNHFSFDGVITISDTFQYIRGNWITGYERLLHPLSI